MQVLASADPDIPGVNLNDPDLQPQTPTPVVWLRPERTPTTRTHGRIPPVSPCPEDDAA